MIADSSGWQAGMANLVVVQLCRLDPPPGDEWAGKGSTRVGRTAAGDQSPGGGSTAANPLLRRRRERRESERTAAAWNQRREERKRPERGTAGGAANPSGPSRARACSVAGRGRRPREF